MYIIFSIWIIALFNIFIINIFQWNEDLLRQEGFPVEMLPPVVAAGTDVGVLSMSWFDIPKGYLRPRKIYNIILRCNCHQSIDASNFIT